MDAENNKFPKGMHSEKYYSLEVEAGEGSLEVLKRLNYSNGAATDYDNISWQEQDESQVQATIGSSVLLIPAESKWFLDTIIPSCQKRGATYEVSQIISEMLAWFLSHRAIFFINHPTDAGTVDIYNSPPSTVPRMRGATPYFPSLADFHSPAPDDWFSDRISASYFVAMAAVAAFNKLETSVFIKEQEKSGKNFIAVLLPSSEILSQNEIDEIQRSIPKIFRH